MSRNLWDRFETNAAKHPGKAVFVFARNSKWETVTYKEVVEMSHRLAGGLIHLGLRKGMRAAMLTPPSVEFFALAFALLKVGITPVITDPAIGLGKITECLRETKPEIFIGNNITHALRFLYGWGRETVRYNLTIPHLLRIPNHKIRGTACFSPTTGDFPAAIIYTSGSTGLPKGVVYTQENFTAQLDMLVHTFDIQPDEIDLPAFPLYALIDALLGVTSIIPDIRFPAPGKIDPARTLSAIQEYGVTNMFASPVVLDRLADYGLPRNVKLNSLKRVITAGAPAPLQLQGRFRRLLRDETNLFGLYGATETLPIALVESREILGEAGPRSAKGAGVCLGLPVDGATVRIIQISDEPLVSWDESLEMPVDQVGEITVKGGAVTGSYFGREDANRLAKMLDGAEIVHRMGDVGCFDEQGRLWYCGRKSHRVATRHGTFFTEQIEGIFNVHPLVYRTALVGVDQQPVLWVELESYARNTDRKKLEADLLALGREHPQASKISVFFFMDRFPTDVRHNSKIIRESLALSAAKLMKGGNAGTAGPVEIH